MGTLSVRRTSSSDHAATSAGEGTSSPNGLTLMSGSSSNPPRDHHLFIGLAVPVQSAKRAPEMPPKRRRQPVNATSSTHWTAGQHGHQAGEQRTRTGS